MLQFDTTDPTIPLASIIPQPPVPPITKSFGLQTGPDGMIYYLYQSGGNFFVGSFSDTDSVANKVMFTSQVFPGNNFNGKQFPSFLPSNNPIAVDFIPPAGCAKTPVSFAPIVSPGADSVRWDFGDGQFSGLWSPFNTYENGGTFDVTLKAFLNGDSASVTHQVTITQFDIEVSLVSDTTACSCSLEFPKNTMPPPLPPAPEACKKPFMLEAQVNGATASTTYQWYGPGGLIPGATTESLPIDSAGYYYLIVKDGTCSTYAGSTVKEYLVPDQTAGVWHFGQNAGIDFNPVFDMTNPGPPLPILGPVNSNEGSASISDSNNGQIVVSTDGQQVYDRTGTPLLTLPPGMGGDPSATQSAVIVAVPGDNSLYYIFTTQEVFDDAGMYDLRYGIFDLKIGTNGGLVDMDPSTPGLDPSLPLYRMTTERIINLGSVVIAHDFGNNCFHAYQVTGAGLSGPIISCAGSVHSLATAENGQGYMKFIGNNMLAVPLYMPGVSNLIEIYDFDASTGAVSNSRIIDLGTTAGQVYGLTYAGNKLFATVKSPGGSFIYEISFDTNGDQIVPILPPINVPGEELGAIQSGPDGQIYVAVNNRNFLGVITPNPLSDQSSTFMLNGFPQGVAPPAGWVSSLGLPNYTDVNGYQFAGPGISVNDGCVNAEIALSATPTDQSIDKYDWQIVFNGNTVFNSTMQSDTTTFSTPGLYEARLRIYNDCGYTYNLTQQFIIHDNPPFNPIASPYGCPDPTATLEAVPLTELELPNLTFAWSTGETTRTIVVDQPGQYFVSVINQFGCSTSGQVLAIRPATGIDLGNDQILCSTQPPAGITLNTGINYNAHAWTVDGVPAGGTGNTFFVDTSVPGSHIYRVTFTDPVNTPCISTDDITITVNETPKYTLSAAPIACAGNTGQILIDITSTGTFTYDVAGFSGSLNGPAVASPITTPTLTVGTYPAILTEQITGCDAPFVATISSNSFVVNPPTQIGTCDPITLNVTHTAGSPITYEVINTMTNQVETSGTTFPTAPVTSGNTYLIAVKRASDGCIVFSPNITVNQAATFAIAFNTTDLCNHNISVITNPAGATTYDWSMSTAGSINTNSGATVNLNVGGPYTMVVTIDDGPGGVCPSTGSTIITVPSAITPSLTQSDACSDRVTLTAMPPNPSYSYLWHKGAAAGAPPSIQFPAGGTQIANLIDDGFRYSVDIFDPAAGCIYNQPDDLAVNVEGTLTLALAYTPACEGTPFTIMGTTNRGDATYTWEYEGSTINGQGTSTLTDTRAGTYKSIVTLASCTDDAVIKILLAPLTPGKLNDRAIICNDPANTDPNTNQIVLNPGDEFTTYAWFKDGVDLGVSDPTYTADEKGLYEVDLTNIFGCDSRDKTQVDIECLPKISGPNAFRPDGLNNEFFLYTFFIDDEEFEVFIFNRWGEMIFQSTQRQFKWNGTYNNLGKPVPIGTYTYLVKYKSSYRPQDGIKEKRGGVLLIR